MKKILKIILEIELILLLLTAITCIAFSVGKISYEPVISYKTVMSAIDSSVHYRAAYKENGLKYYRTCTGVVLENQKDFSVVVTAKHCIADDSIIYIEDITAKKVIKHKTRDLALVILDKRIPYKTIVKQPTQKHLLFEQIFYVGFPGKTFYSQGTTSIQTYTRDAGILTIVSGCSGGGVFNTSGELIGIAIMTSPPLGIYESYRNLANFLAEQDIEAIVNEINK